MELKIFKYNTHLRGKSPQEIMAVDITVLNNIVKGEPKYDKGRKVLANYYNDNAQTELAIQKSFEDVIDTDGFLTGLNITINWFDVFEDPVLVKTVFVPLSITESADIVRKRRERKIIFLQEAGIRLGVKQYIDILFDHYSHYRKNEMTRNLLNSFIENNSEELKAAINEEEDIQINTILDYQLPGGGSIKASFLNQIT